MLTEQTLLQAPESDYMNDEQLAFFRRRLEIMRREICHELADAGDCFKVKDASGDVADRAGREEGWLVASRLTMQRSSLLQRIDDALARIEDASYGYCEETGDAIGLPRLLARPTAPLCLEAQEKQERLTRFRKPFETEQAAFF